MRHHPLVSLASTVVTNALTRMNAQAAQRPQEIWRQAQNNVFVIMDYTM